MNKQVVILGMPRSGTSMLSHVVRLMGVYMGRFQIDIQQGNPGGNGEDIEASQINAALSRGNHRPNPYAALTPHMGKYITERNRKHPLWGFKCPHTAWVAWTWDKYLSNPHYIFIDREPAAVLQSFMRTWYYHPRYAVEKIEAWMDAHKQFLKGRDYLHLQYEELLENQDVEKIADFIGIEGSIEVARAWINPSLNHYEKDIPTK